MIAQDVRILHAEDDYVLYLIRLLDECDPADAQRRELLKNLVTSA